MQPLQFLYMVNRKHTGGRSVLLSFLLLFFLFSFQIPATQAQNITNYYASTLQDNGELYYIYPIDGFKEIDGRGKLTFDITYLTSNDTAIVNISVYSSYEQKLKAIIARLDSIALKAPLRQLMIEPNKRDWHYRYTFKLHFNDIKTIFTSPTPPVFHITGTSREIAMKMNNRKWKKQSAIVRKILQLIELNKNKE